MVESIQSKSEARLKKLAGQVEFNKPKEVMHHDLVESLVNAGYSRTKGGEKSGLGREIYVKSISEKLILRLRDDKVEYFEEREKATGLYIYGFSSDNKVDIEDREFVFMLPRDPSYLTEGATFEVVSRLGVDGVKKVSGAIILGGMITKSNFYKEHNDYLRKLRASRIKSL